MLVFLSWSGARSKAMASLLRDWLPTVIQAVRPWMSAEDVDKGAIWSPAIADGLDRAGFGVICLTPENVSKPWLNFEAGSLASTFGERRVAPLLHDLSDVEVAGPLAQFQSTSSASRVDVLRLLESMNLACGERGVGSAVLAKVFERSWSDFEAALAKIPAPPSSPPPPKRDAEDLLGEILGLLRQGDRLRSSPGPADHRTPKDRLDELLGRINAVAPSNSIRSFSTDGDLFSLNVQGPLGPKVANAMRRAALESGFHLEITEVGINQEEKR